MTRDEAGCLVSMALFAADPMPRANAKVRWEVRGLQGPARSWLLVRKPEGS